MKRANHYYFLAKRAGYRSRAAYKLKELNDRFNLVKRGDIVVDLGAAPGGWVQVAREAVGETGLVVGVDVVKIKPLPWDNVKTLRLDVTQPSAIEAIKEHLPGKADVVLSDLSPKVTGVWEVDAARQVLLARSAFSIAVRILKRGGKLVVKLFQGPDAEELVEDIKKAFTRVKLTKPKASRKGSAEVYVVALGFKEWPSKA